MVGRSLGHYEILEPLGAGGMGEVYRARDTRLDRDVAIKVLPADFAEDPERLARFEREARILAALDHPRIAAIHALEEADGTRFIAMELVEGRTLEHRLAAGPMPIEEALEICRQITEALEAAHDAGIIHRDLKPANVVVTAENEAKVLDFGVATAPEFETGQSATEKATALTSAGAVVGTAPYMSPEQVRGTGVDGRSDIWSLGCLLYELLTGRRAFDRGTVAQTLAAILEDEPPWDALPQDTPGPVRSLLDRCLKKDPARRRDDVAEARAEIDETLQGMTTVESEGGGRRRGLTGAVRRAAGVFAGLVVIATLLVGLDVGGLRGYLAGGEAGPSQPPSTRWPSCRSPTSRGTPPTTTWPTA